VFKYFYFSLDTYGLIFVVNVTTVSNIQLID